MIGFIEENKSIRLFKSNKSIKLFKKLAARLIMLQNIVNLLSWLVSLRLKKKKTNWAVCKISGYEKFKNNVSTEGAPTIIHIGERLHSQTTPL